MKWRLTEKQREDVREYIVKYFNDFVDVGGFCAESAAKSAAKHFNFPDEADEWDCEVIAEEIEEEDWQAKEAYWANYFGIRK